MDKFIQNVQEQLVEIPGHKDSYFVGNGIVGMSAQSTGAIDFCIGPDYTSPNYVERETFSAWIGEKCYYPEFRIRRIRSAGVFFGDWNQGETYICFFDYVPPGCRTSVRLFFVQSDLPVTLRVEFMAPPELKTELLSDSVRICAGTETYCFGNRETLNWAERRIQAGFLGGKATAQGEGNYVLQANCSKTEQTALLLHRHFYATDIPDMGTQAEWIDRLHETFHFWNAWLAKGNFQASAQGNLLQDVIESLLLAIKMQQNADGGMIAGIRKYANSYIRDTHGAMRLLLATGHADEVELLLKNLHHKWEVSGFLPNWWSMGSDSFIGHSFICDASEVTAYYLFMLRDYLRATKQTFIPAAFRPSAEWAVNAQIQWLKAHDMTLPFNGDETEQYCCNYDGEEYGRFINPEYPFDHQKASFPSMMAALASIRWYDSVTGANHLQFLTALQASIDRLFWTGTERGYIWAASVEEDGTIWHHKGQLTNYKLLPLWLSCKLTDGRERSEALACKAFVRKETGFLPNCQECMEGFCGHTMGLMLYDMLQLQDPICFDLVDTILHSGILSMYGTVSEFYGPHGTPNGHNCRPFEGGILGEALLLYMRGQPS